MWTNLSVRLSLLALLVVPGYTAIAQESVNVVVVQGIGIGTDSKEAIADALVQALGQVRGIDMKSDEVVRDGFRQLIVEDGAGSSSEVELSTERQASIRSRTQGQVTSYRIIKGPAVLQDGTCEVTVEAKVAHYKTPGLSPDSRRKLAVMPMHVSLQYCDFVGDLVPAEETARQLEEKVNARIVQTRRFAVVDRAYQQEYLSEKDWLASADTPIAEKAKLGEVLGVDYMLVSTLTDAHVQEEAYKIRATGESGTRCSGLIQLDYRVIVMATRQVKWADTLSISLEDAQFKARASSLGPAALRHVLLDSAAEQLVDEMVSLIYPVRIVEVNGAALVVNQGGNSLAVGDRLDIYAEGERVKDPYSGESLGRTEARVAVAEVVRVSGKLSYLEVVESTGTVATGMVCRPNHGSTAAQRDRRPQSAGRPARITTGPAGGVRLPFD